ncbi:MAG TPA: pirin family protein [Burkholderiales bacterium]|nr:pirin family protein [Burkholderiales bacterium]
MIVLRKSADRGYFDHGWLKTYHTFSFADYFDREHMNFGSLRVINEDFVQAGKGFGTHPHRDMEIITYILEGQLAHKDSMGNGSIIKRGDVQRMSAGTGVTHSEYNASQTEAVHLLQIWILPKLNGIKPGYEQKYFSDAEKTGKLRLVVSPDGRDDSVTIHQDAFMYAGLLSQGKELSHSPASGRRAYLQVARGALRVNGQRLEAGDGVKVTDEKTITLAASENSELLLFDLA